MYSLRNAAKLGLILVGSYAIKAGFAEISSHREKLIAQSNKLDRLDDQVDKIYKSVYEVPPHMFDWSISPDKLNQLTKPIVNPARNGFYGFRILTVFLDKNNELFVRVANYDGSYNTYPVILSTDGKRFFTHKSEIVYF